MSQTVEEKRCAVYTRKSMDERLDAEYNSLEAQHDACAAYIKSQVGQGWTLLGKRYDDGGYSGGTMNRPGLEELLKDVNSKCMGWLTRTRRSSSKTRRRFPT